MTDEQIEKLENLKRRRKNLRGIQKKLQNLSLDVDFTRLDYSQNRSYYSIDLASFITTGTQRAFRELMRSDVQKKLDEIEIEMEKVSAL